jgi:hypothetical protein
LATNVTLHIASGDRLRSGAELESRATKLSSAADDSLAEFLRVSGSIPDSALVWGWSMQRVPPCRCRIVGIPQTCAEIHPTLCIRRPHAVIARDQIIEGASILIAAQRITTHGTRLGRKCECVAPAGHEIVKSAH